MDPLPAVSLAVLDIFSCREFLWSLGMRFFFLFTSLGTLVKCDPHRGTEAGHQLPNANWTRRKGQGRAVTQTVDSAVYLLGLLMAFWIAA